MKKYFLNILLLILLFVSCAKNETELYFSEYNYKISANELLVSNESEYFKIVLPILDNNDKYKIIADNSVGREVYEKYYKSKYSNYTLFLIDLQNKSRYINSHFLNESDLFDRIDTTDIVHDEYSQYGIEFIMNKYLEKIQPQEKWKTRYVIKHALPFSLKKSLIKFMYNNKFYIFFDDYSGSYFIIKDKIKVDD